MACKCYHADKNFLEKIGVCWGTKECEACSCGGDESKCDFYEDKRKRAIPNTTNADRIRAMSDEELAKMINGFESFALTCGGAWPTENWLEWLREEATNDQNNS